jgi:hypothetical protein
MEATMTEKENYMLAVNGKEHPWVPEYWENFENFIPEWMLATDPRTERDMFGIKFIQNEFGRITTHENPPLTDVHKWPELFKNLPDPDKQDWAGEAQRFNARYNPLKVKGCMPGFGGLFLMLINLMGWVEGLCAIAEEPEEVEAFNSFLADYYVKVAKNQIHHIKPDVFEYGEDISNEKGPFVSKECFRKLYKPFYKKIIAVASDAGIPTEFHCCGRNEFLNEEFTDVGVRILQIPRPYDDVVAWKKKHGTSVVLNGGWDWQSPGGLLGADEKTVRQEVHNVLDKWAKGDPAYIFWEGNAVGESEDMLNKVRWIRDEVAIYGKTIYK